MKKILTLIGVTALLATFTINAQVTNSIPNFMNQAAGWATSYNTNYDWTGVTLQFEDGVAGTTGIGAADYIRAQYNFGRINVALEGQFFGTGSAFNDVEAGVGYAVIQKYDFKAEINLLAGGTKVGTSSTMKFKAEPEIKLSKKMTVNTYATMSLSLPYVQGQTFDGTPEFRTAVGFHF